MNKTVSRIDAVVHVFSDELTKMLYSNDQSIAYRAQVF